MDGDGTAKLSLGRTETFAIHTSLSKPASLAFGLQQWGNMPCEGGPNDETLRSNVGQQDPSHLGKARCRKYDYRPSAEREGACHAIENCRDHQPC